MKTMVLLDQTMNPTQKTSGNDRNTASSRSLALSRLEAEQYPKSFRIVMFSLFHFLVTFLKQTTFTRRYRIQLSCKEKWVYLGAFALSCAHPESLGLMVMAWKTLSKQVLLMVILLLTL
jgi:hypothetical protein